MRLIKRPSLCLLAIFSSASAIFTSGCTSWPEWGQGGMAEHHLQLIQAEGAESDSTAGVPGIVMEHDILARHLDVLVLEGAELCFPATVEQARQRQSRISRSLNGGLRYDAANDILLQRHLLARLERQLDYVIGHRICTLPRSVPQQSPRELAAKIDQLLNADNQFAFDSSEINPKYLGRLAEAAALLRDHPDYRLHITGHADPLGEAQYNQSLSLARAKQVARYLQIFGLPAQRITVSAVGADDPLFHGLEPHVRLTNRRVSIELIPLNADRDLPQETTP